MAVALETPIVLVTGASGFIATHIVQQLLNKGNTRVRGTVRSLKNEDKIKPLYDLVPDAQYPLELVEADLNNEESWKEAVQGCSYVYHVASPFPSGTPTDENEIIKPAVNGTLNVFKAIVAAGGVRRVVLTSSIAAITGVGDASYTEKDWAPVEEQLGAYQKSKALAEKAAWNFLTELEEDKKFELAVVNPGIVIGPLLSAGAKDSTSTASILKLLNNEIPALVDVNFNVVDVRDVAAAHIAAMEVSEAVGNRHILVGATISMKEMSNIIANEFKPQGYRIPSFVMPKFGVWVYKAFDPSARLIYPMIGKMSTYANDRMRDVLGIQPENVSKSIIDTCYNLIELGIVPKKPGYRGPTGKAKDDGLKEELTVQEKNNQIQQKEEPQQQEETQQDIPTQQQDEGTQRDEPTKQNEETQQETSNEETKN